MSRYNPAYMDTHPACMNPDCDNPAQAWHHAIYHRMKSVPELNEPENLLHLCVDCHREFHERGYSGRCDAWRIKCEEFTREHMVIWHQGLAMKSKESFE